MKKTDIKKIKKIVNSFSNEKQIIKSIEELSELQKALCKFLVANQEKGKDFYENKATITAKDKIVEEMADVFIMLEQLLIIFENKEMVEEMIEGKIERTLKRYLIS